MAAVWKGVISFGLVSIPVSVFPAVRKEDLKLRVVRKSDLSPIRYKRVAEADEKEVPYDQVVKAYEYEKGEFVPLEEEDFKKARAKGQPLVLELLHFCEELVEAGSIKAPAETNTKPKEMDLARALIGSMTAEWDPEKCK